MSKPITYFTACLLALTGTPLLAQQGSLSSPIGGWNRAGLTDKSGEQAVAYSYALIDRGAQKNRTMIRGQIAHAGKTRPFHQLIVNGNPTPRVTLVFNENTPRERREDLVVPLRGIGELTLVKTFVY